MAHLDEAGFAPTLPTSASWGPVGCPLRVPYEAPQGRRVNVLGAYFTHGPQAGKFAFRSWASLPKSRAKQPAPLEARAAAHGLTAAAVGKIDSEVLLAFLWTTAGRPDTAPEDWRRERPLWYVLDNYSVHKSAQVQAEVPRLAAAGIHLFYLPAYSPELSRIEPVWQDTKYQELPVRSFDRLQALKEAVDLGLARKAIRLRAAQTGTDQLLTSTP